MEDTIVADGVTIHRAGLSASAPSGEEVVGSAAAVAGDVVSRGRFELLERASTLERIRLGGRVPTRTRCGELVGDLAATDLFPTSDEPERWRPARSNGVALHGDWAAACDRALWEVVERDRVLQSWYGAITPRRVPFEAAAHGLGASTSYDWEAHAFDDPAPPAWSEGLSAVGVFGFPRVATAPLVLGYAARPGSSDAVAAAAAEATQLLAFLWGEELPSAAPSPGPTPMHHLEHLLWVETADRLRSWLAGSHAAWGRRAAERPRPETSRPRYADLTPTWLSGGLRVALAVVPDAVPLTFGDAPRASHLPPALRIHPIA